jgi:hypothetical protein
MRIPVRSVAVALAALAIFPCAASARVVRLIVDSRVPIANGAAFGAGGAYDRLTGRIFYAFDPSNPYDRAIVDLDRAPRNANGEVEAWGEFVMLLPHDPTRRNGVTLIDVANRGGVTVGVFHLGANRAAAPTDSAAYGDALLLRQGYTVLTLGWQWDILPAQNGVHFHPPVAGDARHPITGLVRSDITVDAPTRVIPLGHRVGTSQALGYPVSDTADAANVLTVRDTPAGERRVIPRASWRFAREDSGRVSFDPRNVYLPAGFEAGKIYEVVYRAADPVVTGTGLAAVRDVISYLKHDTASIAPTRWGIAYGVSQTGRLLRHLLYQGFNTDEAGRIAYDGIFVHTAGAGRGSFNHRFAQPSRDAQPYNTFFYPTDLFPFHVTPGEPLAKVFYVDGGYEYWGRGASLTHTTVDGTRDVPFLPSERRYVVSSAQHSSPAPFPPADAARIGDGPAWRGDPLDQRLALRALLGALTEWVTTGRTPPPSAYPTLAARTLVNPATRALPAIGGVRVATTPYTPRRIDLGSGWARGVIDSEPPKIGAPFTVLVPREDSLGNQTGGIQSVELRVPLATYFPWQFRAVPPTGELASFQGTFVPLPRTDAERRARGDGRPSIAALYPSRDAFLRDVDAATARLVAQRFMRPEDRAAARSRMAESWDWIRSR